MSHQNEAKALKKLHARLMDTKSGYEEGIRRAERPSVVALFERLAGLRERHIATLNDLIAVKGLTPPRSGSFLGLVSKGAMLYRAAMGTIDRDISADIMAEESTIVALYEQTIGQLSLDTAAKDALTKQLAELREELAKTESTSEGFEYDGEGLMRKAA